MSKHDSARFSAYLVEEKCSIAKSKIRAQRDRDLEKSKERWLKKHNTKFRIALRFGRVKTDADAEKYLDEPQGFDAGVRFRIEKWRYGEDEDVINEVGRLAEVAGDSAIGREVVLSAKSSLVIESWVNHNVR